MSTNPLVQLSELGQSPWYDFISRDLLASGQLHRLIEDDGLRGLTFNVASYEKAIADSTRYDDDFRMMAAEGAPAAEIFEAIASADVRSACDILRPLYKASGGRDGIVSIGVAPALAYETGRLASTAERLWRRVDRPNAMIAVPGTVDAVPAFHWLILEGINVNVTLLFSVERYERLIEAYLVALERRAARGGRLDPITAVASISLNGVDVVVDELLDESPQPNALRGQVATANACAAYAAFERAHTGERWKRLADQGAQPLRPLWTFNSTTDARYPDIGYVEALVAPDTASAMVPATFDAYRTQGRPRVLINDGVAAAPQTLAALEEMGINLEEVCRELEREAVARRAAAYGSLLTRVEQIADAIRAPVA